MNEMRLTKCKRCQGTGKDIDHEATGRDLRRQRKLAGISLRHLAKRMEISAAYLSDLERGNRRWTEQMIAQYREIVTE